MDGWIFTNVKIKYTKFASCLNNSYFFFFQMNQIFPLLTLLFTENEAGPYRSCFNSFWQLDYSFLLYLNLNSNSQKLVDLPNSHITLLALSYYTLPICYHIIANRKQTWQKTWTKIGTFANCALIDICCVVFMFCIPSSQGDAQNTSKYLRIPTMPILSEFF